MRFQAGDIVRFCKQAREEDGDWGEFTNSEGTIITTSFMERTSGHCIHVKWDDEFGGDLCKEHELRLVRRSQ